MKTPDIHLMIQSFEMASPKEIPKLFLDVTQHLHDVDLEYALQEEPTVMYRIIKKIIERDGAIVMNESSQVSELFISSFWQSTAYLASQGNVLEFDNVIKIMHINIEASDSLFTSNLAITEGNLKGNTGLVPFRLEDYRLMGNTNILLAYLIGDLPLGLNNLEIQTAGHSGLNPAVGKIFRTIQNLHRPD